MTNSRYKRRRTHNNEPTFTTTSTIKSLPRDLLVKVVANVASHSFIDFQNTKMSSKDFLDATEDNYVLQRVSLDKFPLIMWSPNEKALSFFKRCKECENIESLYRQGLKEYFDYPNGKICGLENLKIAAQKGHKEAKYVYGMILLCSKDDELRKQGLEHLLFLRKSQCIVSCRNKVEQLSKILWKNNGILERNQTPLCKFKSTCKGWRVKKGRWVLLEDDDDDIRLCENCRWDHELEFFYRLFNVR